MNDAHLESNLFLLSRLVFEVDNDYRLFLPDLLEQVDLCISFSLVFTVDFFFIRSYSYTLFMALLHAAKEAFYMQSTFLSFYFEGCKTQRNIWQISPGLKRKGFLTLE